jgi:hypothetical protein
MPANSSGRVSLDRYQDLEIDLRECSITRQKRVAGPRGWSSEATEMHNQWVNEGGKGQGGLWRRSDAGQGATRHFENASTVGLYDRRMVLSRFTISHFFLAIHHVRQREPIREIY